MNEKMTWLPTWQHSLLGGFAEVEFIGQPQTLIQETWPLENLNWRQNFVVIALMYLSSERVNLMIKLMLRNMYYYYTIDFFFG